MKIWKHKQLIKFTIEENGEETTDFVFSNVISSRFLIILQSKPRRSFECFANFVAALIKENFMSLENVNEQSVGLYKEEWSKVDYSLIYNL